MTDQRLLPSSPTADDDAGPRPGTSRWRTRWRTQWRGRWRGVWRWRRRVPGWLGPRLLLAASLGWLVFVVAHRVLSGRTWVWTLVDLIPPVLFAAVPLLLLAVAPLARSVRWRVVPVLVLAGVLGAGPSGINAASLWHTPPPAPPDAITVVSWNTEYWDQDWRHGGHGVEAGFYRYLRELDADVYLLKEYIFLEPTLPLRLQNVSEIDRVERLRQELPGYHVAVAGSQITLSRFPIVRQRGLDAAPWLPDELREPPEGLDEFPDFNIETLRTDLRVDGTVISFYNSHIIQPAVDVRLHRSETRRVAWETHERQVASLEVLRADIEQNPHPAVLGADLNLSPAAGMLRLLPDRLVDRTPVLDSLLPRTWQVDGLSLGPVALELWQIDWLFTTPDVATHEYELVYPAGLSDHRVIKAVLSTEAAEPESRKEGGG